MDYNKNLQIVKEICAYEEDGTFWMNMSNTKGFGIKLKDVPYIKGCIACKFYNGKRAIGYGGKWIFKSLTVHFPKKDLRAKCSVDGCFHCVSSDNPTENGANCNSFESILPTSYSNLPNVANDITS